MAGWQYWNRAAGAIALFALLFQAPPLGAQNPTGPYVVARVLVDVTSTDAVTAKEEALKDGQVEALRQVLKRLTPYRDQTRLPTLNAEMAQELIEGFSVRRERNSGTRYIASLDYKFYRKGIRELLRSGGLELIDRQAAPIVVIPIYEPGPYSGEGYGLWRDAWRDLDLENALTPVRLVAQVETAKEIYRRAFAGDRQALATLRRDQGGANIVLARASIDESGRQLILSLKGRDAIGPVAFEQKLPVFEEDIDDAVWQAAKVAFGAIEGRWKLIQSPRREAGIGDAGNQVAALVSQTVFFNVEFSGLREWRKIRQALQNVPGVGELDVNSLSARGADVKLSYRGGAQRLQAVVPRHGLELARRGNDWVLRSN